MSRVHLLLLVVCVHCHRTAPAGGAAPVPQDAEATVPSDPGDEPDRAATQPTGPKQVVTRAAPWSLSKGPATPITPSATTGIRTVAASSDQVAVATQEAAMVFDHELRSLYRVEQDRVQTVSFSPDGSLLASSGLAKQTGSAQIVLTDAKTGKRLRLIDGGVNVSSFWATGLAFAGNQAIVHGHDELVERPVGKGDPSPALGTSQNGSWVSASPDGHAIAWIVRGANEHRMMDEKTGLRAWIEQPSHLRYGVRTGQGVAWRDELEVAGAPAFWSGGRWVTPRGARELLAVDPLGASPPTTIELPANASLFAVSADRVVVATYAGGVVLLSFGLPARVAAEVSVSTQPPHGLALSPDGDRLFVVAEGALTRWNVRGSAAPKTK